MSPTRDRLQSALENLRDCQKHVATAWGIRDDDELMFATALLDAQSDLALAIDWVEAALKAESEPSDVQGMVHTLASRRAPQ